MRLPILRREDGVMMVVPRIGETITLWGVTGSISYMDEHWCVIELPDGTRRPLSWLAGPDRPPVS